MTSLQLQLQRLALPQTDPNLFSRKHVASLLFDQNDAATMDRSTFYSLGCSGLEEVQSIEPLLSQFHSSLFSSSSQTLERSVQSRETNAQLDRDIHLFLRLLSPYLLLRPSLKCLEWLIHRYHVHLYNQDSLVSCVLPFHDSKIFVKVIQLLKIQDSDKWSWLQGLQKPGVPLSRLALVSHCQRDLSFMDFICNMVPEAVQAFSSAPTAGGPQLRVLFSFFASTIVSALDSGTVTDAIITKLLPTVQKGLKSSLVDYRAASLMVLCQLAVKVVMETVLVQSLSAVLCKSLRDRLLVPETMGALIVLFQNQDHAGPTKKSLSRLVSVPDLVSSLESLSQTHDVSPLLRHLLLYLLNCTFSSEPEAGSSAELLEKLLSHVPLTSDLDLTLCSELLDRSLSQDDLSHLNQRLQPVLRVLEVKYYSSVDRTFSSRVSSLSEDQKLLFHQLLSLSATCGKYQMVEDSRSSLLLSLNHPQSSLRVSALQKLRLLLSSGEAAVDLDFLKTSVFDRLRDDEPQVVSAALGLLKLVQNSLDSEDIVSSLLLLLKRAEVSYSENWCPVFSEAVQLLSVGRNEGDSPQRDSPEADLDKLVFRLLPLLVPSGTWESVRFRLSLSLSQSPLLQQHPLTRGWRTDLEVALQSFADQGPDQVVVLVQTLVSTLSRNIQSMETMNRHQTLDSLCACVEQLSEFSPGPDLVPLLVLVQTLVLSLRTVSDTHHLLTARRVYRVIERHLQETHRQDMQIPLNLPALGPAPSFSDWLAVFLQRDGQVQSGLVLLSVLWHFIQDLQSPDQSFKGELWWNPERLDNNSCCYLHLLAQVCGLLGGGASHGPITAQYRQLLRLFFKVHLDSPVVLFRFLSLMWSYGGLYGDQVDGRGQARLGVELQLVALLLGAALLESLSTAQLQDVVLKTAVFPSVLVVLASPLREIRRAGLSVLKSLSAAGSSQYQPITERLLRTSEEVVADCSYLRCAMGGLYCDSTHKQEMKASFQKLLQSLVTSQCPCSTSCVLMEALHQVHGQEVLLCLLPALDRLLSQMSPDSPSLLPDECVLLCLLLGKYSAAAAPLLVTDTHCRQLFIQALKTGAGIKTGTRTGTQRVQTCALDQVSRIFSFLNEEVQQEVLSSMFDVLEDQPSAETAQTVASVFKQISLDAQLVASELCPEKLTTTTVQQTRRSRMSRKAADGVQPAGAAVSWSRVTLILELLQHKKKLRRSQNLVPPLFSLLQRRLEVSEEDLSSVEYTKQLLLNCLLSVCSKLSPEGAPILPEVLDPDRFSVELVVQCIRSSEMSQTHHQALLLLSAVASIYPEKVLLNIMPIFTFMGANILRLDDSYSFRVIQKTVTMVIPAVLKAQDSSPSSPSPHTLSVVTRILDVFVDALPHVPEHRRVPVLQQLLSTVGPQDFLWVLLGLMCKQHTTTAAARPTAEDKDSSQKHWDLWLSICCEFSPKVQIQTVVKVLVFLQSLPHQQEQESTSSRRRSVPQKENLQELIFNTETHSSKHLRHFVFENLSFCCALLGSRRFLQQVVDLQSKAEEEEQEEEAQQQRLLEQTLLYIQSVAQNLEQNSDKPTSKFWRILLNKSYELLDKVVALLPSGSFVAVTRGLMGNEVPNVRRKALELFNNKLQQKNWDQHQSSLGLSSDLLALVSSSSESSLNRQTALFSLKLLCRLCGEANPQAFIPVMTVAMGVVMATHEERNVTATALQCVAECVTALKALAIPQLPSLVPLVVSSLKDTSLSSSSELYVLSCVIALQRIMETLASFTSPYLQDITDQVCTLSSLSTVTPPLAARLATLKSTIATKIPSRVLLPTATVVYERLVLDRQGPVVALMSVLQQHIGHMDRDQVSLHQSELTSFFLTALDFRATHAQEEVEQVEGAVVDALVSLVLKLSEVTFKPLFYKLLDWSRTAPGGSAERLLTFLRVCNSLAQTLKGLFVLFSGNLLKLISDLLQPQSPPLFSSQEHQCLMMSLVLDVLHKIFLYDTSKSVSADSKRALLEPLVDQLENLQGAHRSRLRQSLVLCLGQFCVSLSDDQDWKNLNQRVLMKTRSQEEQVRLSALAAVLEICSKLRENYLLLLPETIPFLSELMEDESEEVEKEVQRVVQEMENVLGEPLQSYF